jgi:hypothetical protein
MKKSIQEQRRIVGTLQKLIGTAQDSPNIREWAEVSLGQVTNEIEYATTVYNAALKRAGPRINRRTK